MSRQLWVVLIRLHKAEQIQVQWTPFRPSWHQIYTSVSF